VTASFTFFGGDTRGATAEDVAAGASNVTLRIDTAPRIRVRIARGTREIGSRGIGLTRVEGGTPTERTVDGDSLDWRMAMEGT
jgi:hypothetical protein